LPREEKLTDIPADRIEAVTQDFMSIKPLKLKTEQQPDGNYTLIAILPDDQDD